MGMMDWIQEHPDISLAGGAIGVLLIAGYMFKNKTTPATTPNADTSGLTNGNLVYVPTQTTFSTYNQGAFSNDPNLKNVTNSGNETSTSTKTDTTTNNPPSSSPTGQQWQPGPGPFPLPAPTQPPRAIPPPQPRPVTQGHAVWDTQRPVKGGETLTSIAAEQTRWMRSKGMPGSMVITWNDLYAHNTGVIAKYAQMHGHTQNMQNWIFPGEVLLVPRWM